MFSPAERANRSTMVVVGAVLNEHEGVTPRGDHLLDRQTLRIERVEQPEHLADVVVGQVGVHGQGSGNPGVKSDANVCRSDTP